MRTDLADKLYFLMAAVLGAVVFVLLYGTHILNPTYDAWLLSQGDLTQHYLGWCFYRRGNWTFPIGLTDQLAYPSYSSVIFTDSIPLFAVFFKLLSPILPDTFQYFGWWGILSFMLQGYFSVKILRTLRVGKFCSMAGSIFFILSPTVIEKMFRHTALGGHWLILAAIYLFVKHGKSYRNVRQTSLYWGILGALIASIHLYYLPMCGMFLGGYILCSLIRGFGKEHRLKLDYMLPGVAFAVGLFATTWLLGGFSTGAEAGGDGLGECSFNLNGFFNAKGYSRIFEPLLTYADGQYEGFAYLGLGIFVLILVSLWYLLLRITIKKLKLHTNVLLYGVVYLLMALGLILFAASPQVTFNDKLIFSFPYSSTLYRIWSIFRSTGRIVWPVCYLIFIGVIVCCDRLAKENRVAGKRFRAVLAVCVLVQVFDLSVKLGNLQKEYAQKKIYESPLQSEVWERVAEAGTVKHVVWVSINFDNYEMMHIAKYALDHDMTMNTYYFARPLNIHENTKNSVENLSDDCVYLFRTVDNDNDRYDPKDLGLQLYEADGYIVGTTFVL